MIISKNNEKIKALRHILADKKYAFLDNPKLILEAISAGFFLEYLIINCEKKSLNLNNLKLNSLNCEIIEVNDDVFSIFSSTCNSQGVIGVVKNKNKKIDVPNSNFLILDKLQDPGNVGTLLRTALGANFKDVYLVDCVNLLNDKLIRSSMGAIFKLNIYECSTSEFLSFREEKIKDVDLVVGDMQGENVFEVMLKDIFGIILGNEGNGVSKEMMEITNKRVSIPMKNNLESLNVGVAGAILMYELNKNNLKI